MDRLYTNSKQFIRSVVITLNLDFRILVLPYWSTSKKLTFLYEKYKIIIRYLISKDFFLGKSFAQIKSEKIYYNAPFGLAPYQFVINTHFRNFQKITIPGNGIIVDVGANVGYFSKLARSIYPQARIFAIEPIRQTYQALQQNFSDDPCTKTFNFAASEKKSTGKMVHSERHNELSRIDSLGTEFVQTNTLDSFMRQNSITHIHLLKIDTESHELQILRGAIQTLKETHYLLIEITIHQNNQYTFTELIKELCNERYNFQLIRLRTVPDPSNIKYMDCLFYNTRFAS